MPFPIQNLVTEILKTLQDEWGFDFDPQTELLPLINLSIADIVWLDPLASVFNVDFTLAKQSLQVLPADAVAIVDVRMDLGTDGVPTGIVTNVTKDHLDASQPGWVADVVGRNGAPTGITHFVNDDRDPRRFYVWPIPDVDSWQVQLVYSQVPDDVTLADDYPLPAMYLGASKLYVMARALARRSEKEAGIDMKLIEYFTAEYKAMMGATVAAIETQLPRKKVNRS